MSEQIDIDINVNMNNAEDVESLTTQLQQATAEVDTLTDKLADIEMGISSEDFEEVSEALANAEDQVETIQSKLDELDNTTVEPEVNAKDNIDEVNEKLEETSSTASNLTTALGGIAGVVGIDQMVSTADRINTSYKQLGLTFKDTGVSVNELKDVSAQTAEATGRSGGQVREYFNQMGIAGITNSTLLGTSFQSLAGFAFQSGKSVEEMETKVQKMVMTGNAGDLALQRLGLTAQDLGNAMGVSAEEAKEAFENLTPEERLQAISTAMGDGKQANDDYKNSYEGLKQQAEISMAGLMGAVGQGVLPVITPIIQSATGLVKTFTSTFKSLPGPVQGAVGAIGGFLAVGAAAVGTLGLVGQVGSGVVSGLKSVKEGYDGVKSAMGTAKSMLDALRNSESITEGVRAALAIATGAEATAEGGAAAAKGAAVAPTAALATAENSLLWPILLIIGAVVAVIAVMWYLYNTNETVRNGINWLVAQIQAFINALMPIVQAIISFVSQGLSNLGKLPGAIWNIFLQVISYVASWASTFIQRGIQAAMNFISSVGSALSGIGSAIQSALSGVFDFITAPFKQAYDFIYNNVVKPLQDAWNWLSSAFSGFEGRTPTRSQGFTGADTLNNAISSLSENSNTNNMAINNNFYGLIEESAADYIVNAVNDRLRREKLLKGA